MATTRSKRSNAGNRLQSLLEDQAPLDEEDAKFFAEKEDDEDFDIDAEEERIRQERAAAAEEAAASESDNGDRGESKSGDEESKEDDEEDNVHEDDENFSDTTDDSELENDLEPVDAGEKELLQEQRQRTREKRIAERNKMFKIKQRPPPRTAEDGATAPPKPKKKKIFTSADLMSETRRSERKSAMRNKQHLIEQMKEAEERRAQYVPPKIVKAPKLTQEQRLEEAKKTEIRNLSTLNKFVELEEERKIQQRLAMLRRRPKITHFVRFHSTQYMSPPKLIVEVKEDLDEDNQGDSNRLEHEDNPGSIVKQETDLETPKEQSPALSSKQSEPSNGLETTSSNSGSANPDEKTDAKLEELKNEGPKEETAAQTNDSSTENGNTDFKSTDEDKSNEAGVTESTKATINEKSQEGSVKQEESELKEDKSETQLEGRELEQIGAENKYNDTDVKPEGVEIKPEGTEIKHEDADVENIEIKQEDSRPAEPVVEGPAQLKSYDFLTLHDFHEVHLNRYSIRNIILGPVASTVSRPPLKRMCPFSGSTAKYVDPTTDVAYTNLDTCRLIKLAGENKLGWSRELGGVFTQAASPQRPAKGVPDGF